MAHGTTETRGIGKYIIQFRAPIGLLLIAMTVFMGYWAARARVGTEFNNFFPANHEDTRLYRQFQNQYGGAQTMVLLLRLKHGDIFNSKMLHKIQDITFEMNALPGVNHNEIFSLASLRNVYAHAEPGALISKCFMYPFVPETQADIDDLKKVVDTHRESITPFVNFDNKGAVVTASFVEDKLDYKALFEGIQNIVKKHSDDNTEIYVAGLPVVAGWGYHYLPRITLIFFVSIVLMLTILYVSLGQRSSWWAPILTGSCSAIWGLGFMSLMGYNFDPVMLVIPFILTARDLSHGIQWQGRYYDELDRLDNKILACVTTTDVMLPPGLAIDPRRHRGNHFHLAGRDSGTQGNRTGRRGVAGRQPHDGVRVPADLHELPAAADRPQTALVAERGAGGPPHPVSRFRVLADQDTDHAWAPARSFAGGWRRLHHLGNGIRAARPDRLPAAGHAALQARLQGQSGHGSNLALHAHRRGLGHSADARFSDGPVDYRAQHACGCSGT